MAEKKYAELDGHIFLNNNALGLPFTNTYYKTILGAGQSIGLDIPDIYINNKKVLSLSGDLIYTNLNFTYQQQIRDWLAFNGRINITAQVGTESGALIAKGINLAYGFNMGWMVKVFESRKMLLSSSLFLSRNSFFVADIRGFAERLVDSGGFTRDNNIITSTPLTRGGMRMNYAFAFNKTFGALANLTLDYGESAYREEGDVWNYSYGFGLDADLLPKQKVPLGFLAGFMHVSVPSTREKTDSQPNVLLFQINYTGRKDLNLGMEITYNWYKPADF
ncbi:MAG: hypothetical protein L0Y76_07400, partial [Ignavibacteria bacterium]|nr:hypothetical protein [Ignavibacteria bacterium]